MRCLLVGLLALVGACVDMGDHDSTIVGTSGDVQTAPGDYVGYRVITPCEERYVNIGVVGTGGVAVTNTDDLQPISDDIAATMTDYKALWGHAVGLVCEPGIGVTLMTSDWRDVDGMIARVGDYLHAHDLSLQVGIAVESIPVPEAK